MSVHSLGPNEARILYDAVVAVIALGAAVGFLGLLLPDLLPRDSGVVSLLTLPLLLLGFNAALGIYSRLKTARGRTKALVLLGSVSLSCAAALALKAVAEAVLLWGLLALGPLAIARILLGLPYSKHRALAAISVNVRGPVLVIGGAGYIGSHTVEVLLAQGASVRVLDRLMYGSASLADFLGNVRFELIEGDVTDISKLTSAMQGVSAVVHLAGLVGDPACAVDSEFTRHTNIVATRMAKDVAQSLGVHRFVFASSCSVYGVSEKEVREGDPLKPVSIYAQTKIDSEQELLYSGRDDFFVTVLRFATVFGHSRRPRFDLVANLFTAQAMTEGLITVIGPHQWRPFIHVRDVARAIALTLRANPQVVQGQIFNVGDRRLNMTILEAGEKVQQAVSRQRNVSMTVTDNAGDRRNYAVSFEKIRTMLNFQAATMMEDGIQEMVAHFQAGSYQNYREEIYSNVAMTAKALREFHDPSRIAHLYAPLRH